MFIFGHLFAGMLAGLVFWRVSGDRLTIYSCTAGCPLQELIDKTLGLLVPGFGSGRTFGHSLIPLLVLSAAAIILIRYRETLPLIAFVSGIFLHQILDAMWETPATWFFPFLGPFPPLGVPFYAGTYLWLEITTPAEWIFCCASLLVQAGLFGVQGTPCRGKNHPIPSPGQASGG